MNDSDQEYAFTILTSHGLIPSIADNHDTPSPTTFANWRQSSSTHQYHDRRNLRHGAPIYEVPPAQLLDSTSQPVFIPRMFIILYSTELTGLAPLPPPASYPELLSPLVQSLSEPPYIPLSALPGVAGREEDSPTEFATCLLPTFPRLVESEMHILLQVPSPNSLEWGQHMAQLSALVHSRSCPGGLDHVPVIAAPKFHEFIKWVQLSRKGKRDYSALQRLQKDYKQHRTPVESIPSRHPTLPVPLTTQKRINLICSII